MNNPCPNCGIIGNNFNCPNHISYSGVNPNLDLVPPPQTSVNWINSISAQLFAEIGRLNVLLNERDKEIARLKGLMPPDERGPGFVGQGSWSVFAEKVVAERDALREVLTGLREKGIIDQHNRPLPLEGHHKDCGHGKDGWSLCTCDELKKVDEGRANKQPKCSKCGDTGLVQVAPNARGVKQCDCKRSGVRQPDPLKELNELKECLRWYVENDDTNEGGKWEESNASWLEGKRRAMRALGMEE